MPLNGVDIYCDNEPKNWYGKRSEIDWQTAMTDPLGLKFVISKAGEGTWSGYPVVDFVRQVVQALGAGMVPFGYHFYRKIADPRSQARDFHARMKQAPANMKRPMIDLEDDQVQRPARALKTRDDFVMWKPLALQVIQSLRSYILEIEDLFGAAPVAYSGAWWLDWFVYVAQYWGIDTRFLTGLDLWLAGGRLPLGFKQDQVKIVQDGYCTPLGFPRDGQGKIRKIDHDIWLGSHPSLLAWAGESGTVEEVPIFTYMARIVNCWVLAVKEGPGTGKTLRWIVNSQPIYLMIEEASEVNGYVKIAGNGGWVNKRYVEKG